MKFKLLLFVLDTVWKISPLCVVQIHNNDNDGSALMFVECVFMFVECMKRFCAALDEKDGVRLNWCALEFEVVIGMRCGI